MQVIFQFKPLLPDFWRRRCATSVTDMNNQTRWITGNNDGIVLLSHANALGTIFGGRYLLDGYRGAITAGRHARKIVVTASTTFLAPVRVGNIVTSGRRSICGQTSMEVGIRADAENHTGRTHTAGIHDASR